ncbi:hypothetical protein TCEA9_03780 [Thermobrachium celere]|nr:hypothetical protein TCEA9_03780 [Thermobrachium celere]
MGVIRKKNAKYSILYDGLLMHILNKDNFNIWTISSGKNAKEWLESYENFIKRLYKEIKMKNKKNFTFLLFK